MSEPVFGDETRVKPEHRPTTGMPRWVKVSLIVVGLLIAVFVALKLTGFGGDHGPGRHMGPSAETPSSDVTEHRPPAGVDHGR